MSLEQASGKVELARWLREQATAVGNQPLALKAAQSSFTGSYELADYTAVQQLAGNDWPTIQPQLLEALAKSEGALHKVAIYLHEKMLVQAMQALDKDGFWLDYASFARWLKRPVNNTPIGASKNTSNERKR